MNEKCAPILLKQRSDIVDCVLDEIKRIESELVGSERSDVEACLRKMEVYTYLTFDTLEK